MTDQGDEVATALADGWDTELRRGRWIKDDLFAETVFANGTRYYEDTINLSKASACTRWVTMALAEATKRGATGLPTADALARRLLFKKEQLERALAERELASIIAPKDAGGQAGEPSCGYQETPNGIVWNKPTASGPVPTLIANFVAKIVADVVLDDGDGATQREYEVEASVSGKTVRLRVPASQFAAMNWHSELGAHAIITPGMGTKDHVRAAIQTLSTGVEERHVCIHTGWTKSEGRWMYLTSTGGITATGLDPSAQVRLDGVLSRFALPEPPSGDALRVAVRASLKVLDVAPDTVTVPGLSTVWRAPLGPSGVSVHYYGETGGGKTEVATLIQQHFGPELDSDHVPASWMSTGNYLEGTLHTLKDVVTVIDDFVFEGSQMDVNRAMRAAAQVFRGQGNHAGRGRMRSDRSLAAPMASRGIVLSTGEERPPGTSLAARRMDVEVLLGDVDFPILTDCQKDGRRGLFAEAVAGYVQWLAGRYDEVQAQLREEMAQLRQEIAANGQHRRTPTIAAELLLGWKYFLQFCIESTVLSQEEHDALWTQVRSALESVMAQQTQLLGETDPTTRFIDLLRSAIMAGRAHVLARDGGEPDKPGQWGWREHTVGTGDYERIEWQPRGDTVGWCDGQDLYLDAIASYRVAQSMVGPSGEPLHIALRTLKKRLNQRGLLVTTDEARHHLDVRVKVGKEGARVRVYALHLRTHLLFAQEVAQLAHLAQEPEETARTGASEPEMVHKSGPQTDGGGEKWPTKAAQPLPTGGVLTPLERDRGPVEPVGPLFAGETASPDEEDGVIRPCDGCNRDFVSVGGRTHCPLCPVGGPS